MAIYDGVQDVPKEGDDGKTHNVNGPACVNISASNSDAGGSAIIEEILRFIGKKYHIYQWKNQQN